jgi:phage terminase small subunit
MFARIEAGAVMQLDYQRSGPFNLTDRQKAFVSAYVRHGKATSAAIEAGYSQARAVKEASDLLRMPNIQAAIRTEKADVVTRAGADAYRTLSELAVVAYSNVSNYTFSKEGELQVKEGVDAKALRAVSKVSIQKIGEKMTATITLWPKMQALEQLVKILGLTPEALRPPEEKPVTPATEPVNLDQLSDEELAQLEALQRKLRGEPACKPSVVETPDEGE